MFPVWGLLVGSEAGRSVYTELKVNLRDISIYASQLYIDYVHGLKGTRQFLKSWQTYLVMNM